jgi:hypothetical protein
MVKCAAVSEAEVISEYLKGEYYNPEYHVDRAKFEHLVFHPNLQDAHENDIRRSLLFRRRGFIWQELPPDVIWWRTQLNRNEIEDLRVFPRGKLKRTAKAELTLSEYSDRLRSCHYKRSSKEATHVFALTYAYRENIPDVTAVLIGINERSPISILDGNHRLIAALLAPSPAAVSRFRFLIGFSPRMTQCVWYNNNLANNLNYLRRRLLKAFRRESFESSFGHVQRTEDLVA